MLGSMKKRALAAVLWFYAGWYVGAMIGFALALSPALGPILGTAAAAIVAGDPRRVIWYRRTAQVTSASTAPGIQSPA
jgi:hypothetical protein